MFFKKKVRRWLQVPQGLSILSSSLLQTTKMMKEKRMTHLIRNIYSPTYLSVYGEGAWLMASDYLGLKYRVECCAAVAFLKEIRKLLSEEKQQTKKTISGPIPMLIDVWFPPFLRIQRVLSKEYIRLDDRQKPIFSLFRTDLKRVQCLQATSEKVGFFPKIKPVHSPSNSKNRDHQQPQPPIQPRLRPLQQWRRS